MIYYVPNLMLTSSDDAESFLLRLERLFDRLRVARMVRVAVRDSLGYRSALELSIEAEILALAESCRPLPAPARSALARSASPARSAIPAA